MGTLKVNGNVLVTSPVMTMANGLMPLSDGSAALFANGLAITNPAIKYDQGWLRMTGTEEADSVLELATGDDGTEPIIVRQYNTSSSIVHQITLLDADGNTETAGSITASSILGRTIQASSYKTGREIVASPDGTAAGWYRCATLSSGKGSSNNFILSIRRSYYSPANEGYLFSISHDYTSVNISQLSGSIGGHLLTKIRVNVDENENVHIDYYMNSNGVDSYRNTWYISGWGDGEVYAPYLVSSYTGSVTEFATVTGISNNNGFKGNADTASKWAAARTLSLTNTVTGDVSFDGSGNATLSATIRFASIDPNTFASNFRGMVKGDTSHNQFLATIRSETGYSGQLSAYGSGLGWGTHDTHGYIYVDYSSPNVYIGGGNGNKLNWTRNIAFTDSTVAGANYASSAGNADTLDGYHYNSFAWASHSHDYLSIYGGRVFNRGNACSYGDSAIEIREYGYDDTWGNAPRLSFHWSQRVAAQIGLGSNGWLYASHDTSTSSMYKMMLEDNGTWGISISGNAATASYATSAGNADTIDGHHFHWSGQGGQPTWLWGANEYGNSYVYNPSNFSVNYANSAGVLATLPISQSSCNHTVSGWYKIATVVKEFGSTGPCSVLFVIGKQYNYTTSDMFTFLVQGGYYNSQIIPIGHCDNGLDAYTHIRTTGDGANDRFDVEVYLNTVSGGNQFYVKAIAFSGSVSCHAFTGASGSVMKTYQIQNCTHNGTFGYGDPDGNTPGYGEMGAIYYEV